MVSSSPQAMEGRASNSHHQAVIDDGLAGPCYNLTTRVKQFRTQPGVHEQKGCLKLAMIQLH